MTLKMIRSILLDEENKKYDEKFRREVLLKLATNALPRLNEHTGEDGDSIKHTFEWKQGQLQSTTFPADGQSNSITPPIVG